jgi:tetratricopeptide (TPR) repeat protein
MEYSRSVFVTLKTTIDQLSADGLKLLNMLAWLAPDPVPQWLILERGGPFRFESEVGLSEPEWPAAVERAEGALSELERFSLASPSEDKASFSVHRVIQAVARRRQSEDEQGRYLGAALRWVNAGFPYDSDDVRFWPVAEALAPHARDVAEEAYRRAIPEPTTRLMNQLGLFFQSRAEFGQAEPLMRRALGIDEKSYGSEHPNVAIDLNNLAQLLQATNRLAEAEPLMRRALGIDEKSYGSEHPNVAIRLNNLASLLQATNRLAEAEPLMRRALEIFLKFTRSTGHPHPHLQVAINNYGSLLEELGVARDQVLDRLREMAPELFG